MVFWSAYLFFFILGALLLRGKVLYMVFYTFLIIYVGVRHFVHHGLSNLRIERSITESHVFQGESTELEVVFRNPTLLPIPWVMVKDQLDVNLGSGFRQYVLSLMPFASKTWKYEITGRKRGVYPLGPMTLVSGDPFGLYQQPGMSNERDYVVVYPRLRTLTELGLPSRLPFGDIKTNWRIFEDPSRTIGVRDYQPSDSLKRIHWKVSARMRKLQVKQYQPTMELDTIVFLNLRHCEYDVHSFTSLRERAIETAASVAFYLHNRDQSLGLVSNGLIPSDVYEHQVLDPQVVLDEASGMFSGPSGLAVDLGSERKQQQPDDPVQDDDNQDEEQGETPNVCIYPRTGSSNLIKMLEIMSVIDLAERDVSFSRLVRQYSRRFSWGATLIVVTPEDTEELVQLGFSLLERGYNVVILVTGFSINHPQLRQRGLEIYHINIEPGDDFIQAQTG